MGHADEGRQRSWGTNRRALGSVTATAILGVVVVAVGAVGYLVLNAMEHANTTSSTVHSYSCSPPTAPPCADHAGGGEVSTHVDTTVASVASR